MNIKESISQFLEGKEKNRGRFPDTRSTSFDYCYNYFYSFYKENRLAELVNDKNIQMSCLQLGFYLASWGMIRGSSFLLRKSILHYKNLIIAISKMDPQLWEIDVPNYNEENIKILLRCKQQIKNALGEENNPSETLVTKIMLGVFANVPALDQYFKKSLNVSSVNQKSLLKIKEFYKQNKIDFDSFKIYTYDFLTSKETKVAYTKAKLIDMAGVMDGSTKNYG